VACGPAPLRTPAAAPLVPVTVTVMSPALIGGMLWVVAYAPPPRYTPAPAMKQTRYWDLPTGSRIAYTDAPAQGARRKTPVILVDGGPGAPYGAQPAITATLTRAGFDVYAYHQIGAGLSTRLQDIRGYTLARHVADLDAIRAAIGAPRVDLVGVSWGGQLIANYLAAHPDRVARAAVASPAPIWSPAYPGSTELTPGGERDQRKALTHHPRFMIAHALLEAVGPRITYTLLPDGQMDGEFEAFTGDLDMRAGCRDGHRPYRRPTSNGSPRFGFWVNAMTTRDTEHVADPRPALRRVSTPVLVMRAQCDYLAWPVTREYRDLLPNATLITVPHSGHEISTDQPRPYDTAVRDFLLDTPLPQRPYTAATAP
jgi:proline iminopeptidase